MFGVDSRKHHRFQPWVDSVRCHYRNESYNHERNSCFFFSRVLILQIVGRRNNRTGEGGEGAGGGIIRRVYWSIFFQLSQTTRVFFLYLHSLFMRVFFPPLFVNLLRPVSCVLVFLCFLCVGLPLFPVCWSSFVSCVLVFRFSSVLVFLCFLCVGIFCFLCVGLPLFPVCWSFFVSCVLVVLCFLCVGLPFFLCVGLPLFPVCWSSFVSCVLVVLCFLYGGLPLFPVCWSSFVSC